MSSARKPVTESVGYALKAAQHALRLRMDDALRAHGITAPQYAALSALEDAPGLSGAALARRCFVTPQTMTGVMENLSEAGLVARTPDPDHGRIIQTRLTRQGVARLARAHRAVEGIEDAMLDELAPDQRARLAEWLRGCVRALEQGGA